MPLIITRMVAGGQRPAEVVVPGPYAPALLPAKALQDGMFTFPMVQPRGDNALWRAPETSTQRIVSLGKLTPLTAAETVARYAPPAELQHTLDRALSAVKRNWSSIPPGTEAFMSALDKAGFPPRTWHVFNSTVHWGTGALAGWVCKTNQRDYLASAGLSYNIERVWENDRFAAVIKILQLRHVRTVTKYLYHLPKTGRALTDQNYVVICERVHPLDKPLATVTLSQLHELLLLIRALDIYDFNVRKQVHPQGNLCWVNDGGMEKVVFYDTEPMARRCSAPEVVEREDPLASPQEAEAREYILSREETHPCHQLGRMVFQKIKALHGICAWCPCFDDGTPHLNLVRAHLSAQQQDIALLLAEARRLNNA